MLILHFYTRPTFISCFVTALISLQTTGKTVNNYSLTTIRCTQQKWHLLMPFENKYTLQKWYITYKYSTWNRQIWHPQNMVPYKNSTSCEKMLKSYICQGLSRVIFKRKFLNLLYDSDSWSWDFQIETSPLQNDILGTHLCLIVVGVGPIISTVLAVLQKTNKVVVKCCFLLSAIFGRWYFWQEECSFSQ